MLALFICLNVVILSTWVMCLAIMFKRYYTKTQFRRQGRWVCLLLVVEISAFLLARGPLREIENSLAQPLSYHLLRWGFLLITLYVVWAARKKWADLTHIPDGNYKLFGYSFRGKQVALRFWDEGLNSDPNECPEFESLVPLECVQTRLIISGSPLLTVCEGTYFLYLPSCMMADFEIENMGFASLAREW